MERANSKVVRKPLLRKQYVHKPIANFQIYNVMVGLALVVEQTKLDI
jgi:hypothetical protein